MKKAFIISFVVAAIACNVFALGLNITSDSQIVSCLFDTFVVGGTNDKGVVGKMQFQHYYGTQVAVVFFDSGVDGGGDPTSWYNIVTLRYGTNTFIAIGTNTAGTAYTSTSKKVVRAGVPNISLYPTNQTPAAVVCFAGQGTVVGTNNIFVYGGMTGTNLSMAMGEYSDKFSVNGSTWSLVTPLVVGGSNQFALACTNIFGQEAHSTNWIVSVSRQFPVGITQNNFPSPIFTTTGEVGTAWVPVTIGAPNSDTVETNSYIVIPFTPGKITIRTTCNAKLYFTGSTNENYYGYGLRHDGGTNWWKQSFSPIHITNGSPYVINIPVQKFWLKASATATTFELVAEAEWSTVR
jgi:hypothetical protein